MNALRIICFVIIGISCLTTQIFIIDTIVKRIAMKDKVRSIIFDMILFYIMEIAFYIVVYARMQTTETWWGTILATMVTLMCGFYDPQMSNAGAKGIRLYSVIFYIGYFHKYVRKYPLLWKISFPLFRLTAVILLISIAMAIMTVIVNALLNKDAKKTITAAPSQASPPTKEEAPSIPQAPVKPEIKEEVQSMKQPPATPKPMKVEADRRTFFDDYMLGKAKEADVLLKRIMDADDIDAETKVKIYRMLGH